jgi:1-acyl-sn-glycerol-3-phosphate acyltransferase
MTRVGREHVPKDGPVLLAANHRSFLDPFIVAVCVRRPVYFVAKRELFEKRWQGWLLNALGAFPIRRGESDDESMDTALEILKRGDVVVIFPEGTRIRTGSLGKAKRGVGRMALESGAPVVPVTIHGSLGIRSWRRLRFPKVTIQYGEPLVFEAVERPSREQAQEAAERIFEPVREMYAALEEKGRRGVIESLREGIGARPEPKVPAGQAH